MATEQVCRDWDATARSLGLTPKVDADGLIVPNNVPEDPDIPDRKTKIYVVWVGHAVGLFYNWGLASAMVCRFSGAAHKCYFGLRNACAAWEQGPTRGKAWRPPRPLPARLTLNLPPLAGPPQDINDQDDGGEIPDGFEFATRALPIQVPISRTALSDMNRYRDDDTDLTVSSVSSPTVTTTPLWMSSGTLTPRIVSTPLLMPSMANLSLGEKYTQLDHMLPSVDWLTFAFSSQSSAGTRSAGGGAHLRPHSDACQPHPSSRRSSGALMEDLFGGPSSNRRQKGDPVWVIVQGDRPGVYIDYHTALLAAGFHPAMKMVDFRSLSRACLYFVQQYMCGHVGVPVFIEDDLEDSEYVEV